MKTDQKKLLDLSIRGEKQLKHKQRPRAFGEDDKRVASVSVSFQRRRKSAGPREYLKKQRLRPSQTL